MSLQREISQVNAAVLLRDFPRMEGMRLFGSNLTSLPGPSPAMLRALVSSPTDARHSCLSILTIALQTPRPARLTCL